MGEYTKMIRLNPSELDNLDSEDLYLRFYPNGGTSGDELIDLDKSLPGIIYLLSPDAKPENPYQLSMNGEMFTPLADQNKGVSYRTMMPELVVILNQLLSIVTKTILEKKFDPLIMMALNIYPNIWDNGRESYDYLYTHFIGLKKFISDAAYDENAVIVMTTT